ncbi:unnamed protein product [Ectocarpus sp. CCAP 1310/34]|nr:unnamed protein product [Ectocarpus sp. CCAP 1310/34]
MNLVGRFFFATRPHIALFNAVFAIAAAARHLLLLASYKKKKLAPTRRDYGAFLNGEAVIEITCRRHDDASRDAHGGDICPSHGSRLFPPLIGARLREYPCWRSSQKGLLIAIGMTFFGLFDMFIRRFLWCTLSSSWRSPCSRFVGRGDGRAEGECGCYDVYLTEGATRDDAL